jgi:PAS domain S-box-containing protein
MTIEPSPPVDLEPASPLDPAALVGDALWRQVFEHSPVALSLIDPTGHQLAGNAAYRAHLGYERDELVDLDVERITREEDRAWTRSYLDRLVSGTLERYTTEKLHVRKDGTTVRIRLDISPVRVEGRCVALLGAITPIEQRRPIGEGVLRKLIENIHDTVSLVDAEGTLLETSGRYRTTLGYPLEFWEQRSIFDMIHPEDLPRAMELSEQVFARPGDTVSAELRVISAENEMQVLELYAVNLLDDPDIGGIVLTTRNITEHRALVEDLRRRHDDAIAEAELRSRILATVSHELRNPLHAVQGISELLSQSDLPETERDMAGTINRQVRDLVRVVDDLLTATRLELDSVSLELEPVDVRGLLADVVAIGRAVAAPQVEVSVLIDPTLPGFIRSDPVRLRQVMSNLVGNAVKFTESGRVRVLAAVEGGDRLVVEVIDTGAGIPPDELSRIFEPFRSATTTGRGAGAGLGLSIVHRIVGLLGGSVEVHSRLGVGSTFRVELPLDQVIEVAEAVTDPTAARPDGRAAAAAPRRAEVIVEATGHPAVLVIEDNAVNQQLARAQLRSMGHRCTVVGSGEEGIAHLASPAGAAVDVVLLDYHLPGIDGLETARRIRDAEARAAAGTGDPGRVAIIGVTASASLADRANCLAAGMDDHVPKPVSLADLNAAFERVDGIRAAHHAWRERCDAAGSSAPGPRGAAAVDVAVLATCVAELDDRGIVEDLVTTFLDELDGRIAAIVTACDAGDTVVLRRLVHTITSSARLLGAASLATACEEHESGSVDAAHLVQVARRVRDELEHWSANP